MLAHARVAKQPKDASQKIHNEVEERSFKHRVINSNRKVCMHTAHTHTHTHIRAHKFENACVKEGQVNLLTEQINQTLK